MYITNQKPNIGQQHGIIGVFPCLETAGQALDQLVFSGFPLAQLFLIGNRHLPIDQFPGMPQVRDVLHQVPLCDLIKNRGRFGQLMKGWIAGSIAGGLLSLGLALLPGVGVAVLGAELSTLLLSGMVFAAAGGLLGAFVSLGITENQAKQYTTQISRGNYLLIVVGTRTDIFRAEHILHAKGIHQQSH